MNFFTDNDDLRFVFDHYNLPEVARLQEDGFTRTDGPGADYAPADEADALDNYQRVLTIVGDLAANVIAPRAEAVDEEGNLLNEDGTVTLHPLVADNIKRLGQADLMGFTLPRKYGGLNCPNFVYTMAIEMVSRADASLMNIFGLQGIAETIYAFADDEIRDEYLPRFARGEVTGAMVLTEPDAGSDLQAVRLRAVQDDDGQWYLRGVKRFITNGCGDVLLTLARSEADVTDGRGLSLYVSERGAHTKIRHLEHKLGIHGSPTCEMVYDDAPARLIGQRQRGLITYVMALMNGARVGVAAQSLGIAEAAQRLAREYAHSRKQFGTPIERLPAVAEMLTDMKVQVEATRALMYETSRVCDLENNTNRVLEWNKPSDPAAAKQLKERARWLKKLNSMLTPMIKYYASEMSVQVANTALQVLGGSGYMKDYPAERYLRDARITTIYEGTSQLQVVACVRGTSAGAFEKRTAEFEQIEYADAELVELKHKLTAGRDLVLEAIRYVKSAGTDYLDLAGRKVVDSAAAIYIGHLLLMQAAGIDLSATPGSTPQPVRDESSVRWAAMRDRKKQVARRFINTELPRVELNCRLIHAGDRSPLDALDVLAGPIPSRE